MDKIMFPTDFTSLANTTLLEAARFAKIFNAELVVCHAYHRPVSSAKGVGVLNAFTKELNKKFKQLVEDHDLLKNIETSFIAELGFAKEVIPAIAQQHQVDLIIMATKGARGIDQLWGSKTSEILKHTKKPVIVMPAKATLQGLTKAGLVCDYSNKVDYNLLNILVSIGHKMNLEIDVFTLNKSNRELSEQENAYRMLVQTKLKSLKATFNYTFSESVDSGIIQYAKHHNIGMVAILPGSYGFITGLFHDSLTEKMLYRSPIPLLILK